MNKELTEAELQAIRDEAESKYPISHIQYMVSTHKELQSERSAYIAALTAERKRSKILVEALEKMIGQYYGIVHTMGQKITLQEAREALSNYQNK